MFERPESLNVTQFLERKCQTVEGAMAVIRHLSTLTTQEAGRTTSARSDRQALVRALEENQVKGYRELGDTLLLAHSGNPADFLERRVGERIAELDYPFDGPELTTKLYELEREEESSLLNRMELQEATNWLKGKIVRFAKAWELSPDQYLSLMRVWDEIPQKRSFEPIFRKISDVFLHVPMWTDKYPSHPYVRLVETKSDIETAFFSVRSSENIEKIKRLRDVYAEAYSAAQPLGFMARYLPKDPIKELSWGV